MSYWQRVWSWGNVLESLGMALGATMITGCYFKSSALVSVLLFVLIAFVGVCAFPPKKE